MNARASLIFVLVMVPALALPVQGSIFRKNPPRVDPAKRVPELLSIIKTGKEDRKRAAAVEELRGADAKTNPEVVPVLVEALLKDPASNVRLEAAQTLGRIRPLPAGAGQALEQAATRDSSRWVRFHARSALVGHRLAGSSGKKTEEAAATPDKKPARTTTSEPALISTSPTPKIVEKPAPSVAKAPAAANSNIPRPLPANPAWSTAVPVPPARATPPSALLSDGPVLAPPK